MRDGCGTVGMSEKGVLGHREALDFLCSPLVHVLCNRCCSAFGRLLRHVCARGTGVDGGIEIVGMSEGCVNTR